METRQPGIIATVVVFIVLSCLFSFARVYSRLTLRLFKLDDWLLVIAWAINIALSIITFFDLKEGTGIHVKDIKSTSIVPHLKYQYATGVLYYIVLPLTKLAICLTYQRIVESSRTSKILIRALMIYLLVTGIGLTGYIMAECTPIDAYWNDQDGAHCWKRRSISKGIFFVNAGSNTFTDICIIAIVLPVIQTIQLVRVQKILLYCVVCIGWLAVIASVIRMIIISQMLHSVDPSWDAANMNIWSCVECNTSLICATAPCTRPFINKIRANFLPSFRRNTGDNVEDLYATTEHTTVATSTERISWYPMRFEGSMQAGDESRVRLSHDSEVASKMSGTPREEV